MSESNTDAELEKAQMRLALKSLMDMAQPYAEAIKEYYNALIAEGFMPEQALRIVIAHGYTPPIPGKSGSGE